MLNKLKDYIWKRNLKKLVNDMKTCGYEKVKYKVYADVFEVIYMRDGFGENKICESVYVKRHVPRAYSITLTDNSPSSFRVKKMVEGFANSTPGFWVRDNE